MTQAQHTPGPWIVDGNSIRTQAEPGWLVATLGNTFADSGRLIAAAPDMAAALRDLAIAFCPGSERGAAIRATLAAIDGGR